MAALLAVAGMSAGMAAFAAATTDDGSCPACDAAAGETAPVLLLTAAASAPATQAAVDVGNTKCMVMPDDDVTPGKTVTYDGKIYHFCCDDCIADFKKDPAKYIKAMQADPKKYGVK
jgi:hypothetical protein